MTERERLIELLRSAPKTDTVYGNIKLPEPVQTLQTIADHLLANGVIVLPCKIGEKLYDTGEFFLENCSCPEIYELKDDEMTIHKRPHGEEYRFTYDSFYIGHDDIGKTVFLSRELAEKALAERSKE